MSSKSRVSRKALAPKTPPKKLSKKASVARANAPVISAPVVSMARSTRSSTKAAPQAIDAMAIPSTGLSAVADAPAPDWIPLVPSGVMVMPGSARPVFLLKHEASGETLPVWMHPLDASVALQELGQGELGSPHAVTRQILGRLGITHGRCYFVDRVGHHQYAVLHLTTEAGLELPGGAIRVRADEVISFCLALKVHFFSTKEFIAQCRVLNQELEKLQEGLLTGTAGEAFPELEIDSKKTGYMM
ncbi:MAG: hypothetical protein U1E10_16165 [Bdellovibrionales bacterium]|nr:hypothetical protein [Bdellovibrionales bacterium]